MLFVGVPTTAQVTSGAIQELEQIFDNHGHVIGTLAPNTGGGLLKNAHAQCLGATLALGNTELNLGAGSNHSAFWKSGRVQENFLAVIGVDEAEAFVCVVELDLAGGHGVAFL
jgi:hypothetical protein